MSPSLFSLFAVGLAACAPLASAYTTPVGASPSGNAIYTPSLHQVVPAGEAFNITWNPTTEGQVSLVLLKGLSDDAVPYSTIVESMDNSGSYVWTPSISLAPNTTGYGYGIELIVVKTGQYQYSTQFGISNPDYSSSNSSSNSSTVGTLIDTADSTVTVSATLSASAYKVTGVPSSGWMSANTTQPKPTGNMTVPASLKTASETTLTKTSTSGSSATASVTGASASATQTGAAAHFGASFGGLLFVAGMAAFTL